MLKYLLPAILAAAPAFAQSTCGDPAAITHSLRTDYSETPRAMGLANDGALIEVWASESGSWTITARLPNGFMCLVGAGQSYETLAAEPKGDPA